MAISINKIIDISTKFPSVPPTGRSFGGLVFTATPMNTTENVDLSLIKADYDANKVVEMSLSEIYALFGENSEEYKFANGYYGYLSPSGRFASALKFAKMGATETPRAAFERVRGETNMFGSFTFLSVGGTHDSSSDYPDASIEQLVAVAQDNEKLDSRYLFVVNYQWDGLTSQKEAVKAARAQFGYPNNEPIQGTAFVAGGTSYFAYMPMAIFAATDYAEGEVTNHMFKQFTGEHATVKDDATYAEFNALQINFYGQTQTNGATINFYQRGFNTDGTDTAIYCNEIWFKSGCETSLMNILLGRERLSADDDGVSTVVNEVYSVCGQAVANGAFMPKTVSTEDQKSILQYIAKAGGTNTQGQDIISSLARVGYAVFGYLAPPTQTTPEYYIRYTVFYGTADSIRFIKGDDILVK